MQQTARIISTYSADVMGVCSALYELGGMVVMHDASGCNSTYTTHDEPRWFDIDSMIYISGLSEMEAIMGDDDKLIDDVAETAEELQPKFIALAGTPIPTMTGFDFEAVANVIEERTGIPTFGFATTGMNTYVHGASMAFAGIAERFVKAPATPSASAADEVLTEPSASTADQALTEPAASTGDETPATPAASAADQALTEPSASTTDQTLAEPSVSTADETPTTPAASTADQILAGSAASAADQALTEPSASTADETPATPAASTADQVLTEPSALTPADINGAVSEHFDAYSASHIENKRKDAQAKQIYERTRVNILGLTPLDFSLAGADQSIRTWLLKENFDVVSTWAMGNTLDELSMAAEADVNLVVSAAGIGAAEVLYEKFGIPYVTGLPIGGEQSKMLSAALTEAADIRSSRCISSRLDSEHTKKPQITAVIGEGITSLALASAIELELGMPAKVLCATECPNGILRECDRMTADEDDIIPELEGVDYVVADPMYRPIIPAEIKFVELPHEGFSGRLYRQEIVDIIAEPDSVLSHLRT